MRRSLQAASVLLVFMAVSPLFATSIEEVVRAEMTARNIPGCSVAVVHEGKVVFAKGFGKAHLELDVDATEETVYEIASLTKPFTAVATLTLVNDGTLSLEDRLSDLLETCPTSWESITVRQLLNHTSGIKSYTGVKGFMQEVWFSRSPLDLIAQVEKLPLNFAPGEGWDYSNSNYVILGTIIEKKSGMAYGQFLQEKLFRPLCMNHTQYNNLRAVIRRRAAGYERRDGELVNRRHTDPSNAYAAGALVSTVKDLAKWDAALYTDALLSEKLRDSMWAEPVRRPGMINGYGYGWYVSNTGSERGKEVFHGGGIPGFGSRMSRYPQARVAIIVLANVDHADVDGIAEQIAHQWFSNNPAPVK